MHTWLTQWRWIVSPAYDLTLFIGGALVSLLFLVVYLAAEYAGVAPGGEHVLLTYFVFSALFDQPHIFQTFSRTHYDRDQFQRHPILYTWGLPAFIAVGVTAYWMGYQGELIVFAALYGMWHIMRQHWGFMQAYRSANGDHDPIDAWLDRAALYVGMIACTLHNYSGLTGPEVIYKNIVAPFPSVPEWLSTLGLAAAGLLFPVYVGRQIWLWGTGRGVNLPKLLVLVAALAVHWVLFFFAALPFLIAEAIETAYHDVQYHGWMANYQKRRFRIPRVALRWGIAALVYGLIVASVELVGLIYNKTLGILFAPFTMIVIYHYYVDGKIWKFSEDAGLRADLFGPRQPTEQPAP